MRQVILGKTGLKVSAVGFGGIPIQRVSAEQAVATLRRALDLGVTFIDTAAGYTDSQEKIGLAIRGRRDGLVLASKSGQRTAEGILADIDHSRKEMGADVIDLYQLHGVSSRDGWNEVSAPGGAMEGLLAARDKGWIAHVGFTSHSLDLALEIVEQPVFETVQFPFNLVTREPAERLVPRAAELKLGFIVMKPLCGGQYGDANLAFKFLNGFPDLVPIPGMERPEEVDEVVAVVASGRTLQGEELARAEKIAAELGKLFCRRCGYCMPCPEGVPITTAMVFESFLKRLPLDKLVAGPAKELIQRADECTECGECEKKCPFELPIIRTIKNSLAQARRIAGAGSSLT